MLTNNSKQVQEIFQYIKEQYGSVFDVIQLNPTSEINGFSFKDRRQYIMIGLQTDHYKGGVDVSTICIAPNLIWVKDGAAGCDENSMFVINHYKDFIHYEPKMENLPAMCKQIDTLIEKYKCIQALLKLEEVQKDFV